MTASGQPVSERPTWFLPGARMPVPGTAVALGGIALIFVTMHQAGGVPFIAGPPSALVLLAGIMFVRGASSKGTVGMALRRLEHEGVMEPGEERKAAINGRASIMAERKSMLLRLDPAVHDALAQWASEDQRSTNAQIEHLLRRALAEAGRLPTGLRSLEEPANQAERGAADGLG